MHPMLTQTPPSLSRSTTAVASPSWAARMAQTYPAGPPPMMMTSNWVATVVLSLLVTPAGGGPPPRLTLCCTALRRLRATRNRLPHQRQRILQHGLERLEEPGSRGAVDHPVIARHGEAKPPPDGELPLVHGRLFGDASDRQDARLRRVDYRRELVDVEHAEIGDGERAAGVLLGHEPAFAAALGQVVRLGRDLPQRLEVRVADHRCDQSVLDGHGHAHVHLVPVADPVLLPPSVARRVLSQCQGHRLEDDVVEGHLRALAQRLQRFARAPATLHVYLGREIERGD